MILRYRVCHCNENTLQETIDGAAEDGWRVVSVCSTKQSTGGGAMWFVVIIEKETACPTPR